MEYRVRIEVGLKPGHNDPEGKTTARLLRELGYKVGDVDISKVYSISLRAESREKAKEKAEEMSTRLLANPTKDEYEISIEEEE